jgi:pyruvate/2-oxoglutarate/acetoin dehydrogenase E1 component
MYDEQVTLPLVVRLPMGGRRGYGPTHSQSIEKLLLGVPGVRVVAASEHHDVGALLEAAIDDDEPVFFIENKLMYGRQNVRPSDGLIGDLSVRETPGPYPVLTLSGNGFGPAAATVVTYGGMLPIVVDAVTDLIVEEEVFAEVVVLSELVPRDLSPLLESVARTGALVTAEEGGLTAGLGAELAARVTEQAWDDLRRPVRRVAAADGIIPAAPELERAVLPSVGDVAAAVAAVAA